MHELSIALSIIEGAEEEAARHRGKIIAVHLRLGPLSGVVRDALCFAYEIACRDTTLAGSRLQIEEVPVVVFCSQCRAEHTLESIQSFSCPVCGAPAPEVLQGRELELVALELGPPETLELKRDEHDIATSATATSATSDRSQE